MTQRPERDQGEPDFGTGQATEMAWTSHCLLLLACLLPMFSLLSDGRVWVVPTPDVIMSRYAFCSIGWVLPIIAVLTLLIISRVRLVRGQLRVAENILLVIVIIISTLVTVLVADGSLLAIVPVCLTSVNYGRRAGLVAALLVCALFMLKGFLGEGSWVLEVSIASSIVLVTLAWMVGGAMEMNKRLLADAERERDNLWRLVESIPFGVCVLDDTGRMVHANRRVGEIENRLVAFLTAPGEERASLDLEEVEFEGQHYRVYRSHFLADRGENRVLIIENISERLRLEEEVRRTSYLAAVGEMAAGLAHEIRNPLAVVSGYLQLLLEKDDAKTVGDVRPHLQTAFDELGHLGRITTEFLNLARPREVTKQPCNLNKVVGGMKGMLANQALREEVTLDVVLDPDLPEVHADPGSLGQVVLNLVGNAYQAAGRGGRVRVATYHDRRSVCLEVWDDGPGVPEELRERIFVPFFTTKDMGTGIGLSVCRRIALEHDGSLGFSSSLLGTRFLFRLPIP